MHDCLQSNVGNCVIKGITNEKHFDEYGMLTLNAFQTQDREGKSDYTEYLETSINWFDEEAAISFSLSQVNNDYQPYFSAGLLFIPNEDLARLKRKFNGDFEWIREENDCLITSGKVRNKYHGNILLKRKIRNQALLILVASDSIIYVKRTELTSE